ncbi:MAG: VOC family protein [Tahibacter sp.]
MPNQRRDQQFDFIEFPAGSVTELQKAAAFFQAVFGWNYKAWGDDYSDTQDSGIGSGINADPSHQPAHPLPVIYTTDLEAARSRVMAAQGTLTRDIFSFPGGRRFHFTDPSGNELAVWSDAEAGA